ncbi:ureidoglycolate lyase [Devosia sp. MC521]|uniref:ureidoglycolate lyase n=1 Tax=Devosia sp. MC521 TaxID=2759954 RepID=UPI0015F9F9FC|nr:ureidoglycolate lyase [Devosia sp. MC521]MBJ6987544.1 ureidoglycolate lyase [Devosia sp. MC521]QMW61900.1 ureidoglycolate lyase [Devosia sp. MC521]
MNDRTLRIEPLTAEAFAPFGQVIQTEGSNHFTINRGMTERYHDLATIQLGGTDPRPMISLFAGQPYALPLSLDMVERHPLGSQAFYPTSAASWLVIVAENEDEKPVRIRAFRPAPGQGVNIAINTWHGVLCPIEKPASFIVIDRGGLDRNLEEHFFDDPWLVDA